MPLVSICVITYNSSEFIIATLESIKNQTYTNIELIISDDNSKDNTIEIVHEWTKNNKTRFSNIEIITVENNTGVTGNCNRAFHRANGEYIKGIGGDDILDFNYVTEVVDYLEKNTCCDILFTSMRPFVDSNNFVEDDRINYNFFKLDVKNQFISFIKNDNGIPTPTAIYRATCIKTNNYFDERYPMWEDGPLYFKLLKNNVKFFILEKKLVDYRIRNNSLSNGVPARHKKSMGKFYFSQFIKYDFRYNGIKFFFHFIKNSFFILSDISFFNELSNFLIKRG